MVPFVSIVVVNFNGESLLRDCLTSLGRQDYPRQRLEVIVVDNASSDDSVELSHREYPWVRLLPAGANLGFAGGNNAGFAVARGEWIALLNNDAVAEPNWISESVRAGMAATDIGGVAGHLVFRGEPNIVNSTGLKLYRDGRAGDRDFRRLESEIAQPGSEVLGGCGAALLLRREMVQRLGGFDGDMFMYYEDLDLAWRARQAGWRFVYAPAARVHHAFGGSVGVASPLQTRFVERNRAIVNLKHAPVWLATATALGLFARLARSGWRWLRGQGTTAKHVSGMARALADVGVRLPTIATYRLANSKGDAIYRQWSRPSPR